MSNLDTKSSRIFPGLRCPPKLNGCKRVVYSDHDSIMFDPSTLGDDHDAAIVKEFDDRVNAAIIEAFSGNDANTFIIEPFPLSGCESVAEPNLGHNGLQDAENTALGEEFHTRRSWNFGLYIEDFLEHEAAIIKRVPIR